MAVWKSGGDIVINLNNVLKKSGLKIKSLVLNNEKYSCVEKWGGIKLFVLTNVYFKNKLKCKLNANFVQEI